VKTKNHKNIYAAGDRIFERIMPMYFISDDRLNGFVADNEEEAKEIAAQWFATNKPRPDELLVVDVGQ